MAGHVRYTAVLDACVIYQLAVIDALMSLALTGLFAAKWTKRIEHEWITNLEQKRPELKGKLEYRRDCMRQAVLDWEVDEAAWQSVAIKIKLPDKNDEHILLAAIAGHADCIVTNNIKDFPKEEILNTFGIEVIDPDDFIINQWDLDNVQVISAFKKMRQRRKKPDESAEEFAATLEKNGLPKTAERLRQAAYLI